ncbi:hypothetical protein O0L34_g13141 [Tuta absoluta]|nr:hypothetical protein O0L34_g13141 [Tuta absoluta]
MKIVILLMVFLALGVPAYFEVPPNFFFNEDLAVPIARSHHRHKGMKRKVKQVLRHLKTCTEKANLQVLRSDDQSCNAECMAHKQAKAYKELQKCLTAAEFKR